MKENMKKRLFALLLGVVMVLSLAACGSGGNQSADQGEESAPALTEEEYLEAVQNLSTEMTEIQTNASTAMSDPEAGQEVLDAMKSSMNDFIAITPPEAYADAHEKLQSGCQALIDFIDTAVAMSGETDQTKLAELSTQMQEQMSTALADMAEGAAMLESASE